LEVGRELKISWVLWRRSSAIRLFGEFGKTAKPISDRDRATTRRSSLCDTQIIVSGSLKTGRAQKVPPLRLGEEVFEAGFNYDTAAAL